VGPILSALQITYDHTCRVESLISVILFFSAVHTTHYILGMNFDYCLIMLAFANFILLSQVNLRHETNLIIDRATVLIM